MNSTTKALAIIFASVAVCMLIYAPLTQAADTSVALGDEEVYAELEQETSWNFRRAIRARVATWFVRNAETVDVDGTVVVLSARKLVLNTADDQIRVILPAEWTVDNQVYSREELFTNGYLNEGDAITIKTLCADATNKEGVQIFVYVGYEMVNPAGVQAIANLAINIEA